MNGWHASGLDVDGRDFDTYAAFLRTWLKTKRLKHTADVTPLRRDGRQARPPLPRRGRRRPRRSGRPAPRSPSTTSTPTPCTRGPCTRRRRWTRSSPTPRTASSTPAARHGGRLARSPLDLLREAVPVWADVLRPGGAWASPGTPTWPRATTRWPCSPPPASRSSTTARTAPSRTASTRRSSGTCSSLDGRFRLSACRWTGTTPPAAGLRRRPPQGRGDPSPGGRRRAHRLRRARRASRGDLRRQDVRRPRPHHRRPAEPRDEQPARCRGARPRRPPPATSRPSR